jgi:Holliday junction DNA helicase RuvB
VFTLVAATTEEGDLPSPLLGRFGLRESLGYYPEGVLAELVTLRAKEAGVTIDARGADRLAAFARGTPREALRLLDRVLDDAAVRGGSFVGDSAVTACLDRLGFDAHGLEPLEQRYVSLLRRSLEPVPLARLARVLGASVRTLLRDVEPFLFRLGLLEVTPRGRAVASRPRLLEA